MASAAVSLPLAPSDGYRLWARSYDLEHNPMLSLEQRILGSLIPPMTGLDVVDLGCGTGRWLAAAKNAGARSLVGVDISPEMLDVARTKLANAARLVCGECATAEIPPASADLAFCNFVLSYLEAPGRLLRFAKIILRAGGSLFLTDVHPGTASELRWRRGVGAAGAFKEIRTHQRSINEIVGLCKNAELQLAVRVEVPFGPEERAIFKKNGKQEYFDRIGQRPAIYCLQAIPRDEPQTEESLDSRPYEVNGIRTGRLALGPFDGVAATIRISRTRVKTITTPETRESSAAPDIIDLRGYLVLPGLVNAHDHLEFALFPRMGRRGYRNSVEWAEDIHRSQSEEIIRQRQIPKQIRLWWGGIRNVLCGVTTVCHHNPFEPLVFSEEFIVRVVRNYGWAHSLAFDSQAALKKRQTPNGQPFFIHLAEGIDEQSAKEIFALQQAGALDEHTVVIHGLALEEEGSALLRAARASLIWCPSSNLFLFGRTMSPAEVRRFPRVALGSDSPLTAEGDLLDEIRCAHDTLVAPDAEIYGYVTNEAAEILHLENAEGRLRANGIADLMAMRDDGRAPAERLTASSYRDVELVLLRGRVQLLSPELKQRFPAAACEGLQALSMEGVVRWIRAPLDWLFAQTHKHVGDEIFLGGKSVCRAG
jgi:cytosine/adenosine deaminase-related metal-dependent hydrolase/SAM-dependent methyltransferase